MTVDEDKPYGTEQDPYAPDLRPGRGPVHLRLVDGVGSGCPRTAESGRRAPLPVPDRDKQPSSAWARPSPARLRQRKAVGGRHIAARRAAG